MCTAIQFPDLHCERCRDNRVDVAFKTKKKPKERVELISLIDMVFILLVFFLVTSFVIQMPVQERSISIPTPENALGRAQIVLQYIDEDRVFWLDESATSVVEEIEENFGYLSPVRLKNRIISELIARNTFTITQIENKIEQLRTQAAQDPSSGFFILIRCPNEIPFFRVIDVITVLSDTPYRNIKYGCGGGTLSQIQQCQQIYTVVDEDDKGRQRKNIRIDL